MEAKITVYIFLLLGIIGVIYGVYYTTDVDEATRELALASQQVGAMENHIASQKNYLELRKEVAALMAAAAIMNREKEAVQAEIQQLRRSIVDIQNSFQDAIVKVREESVGLAYPEVMLANGTLLKNVKIQGIDGNVTTMLHSEGVSKIPAENLSTELQDRLRFIAITPQPQLPGTPQPESGPKLKEQLQNELAKLEQQLAKLASDAEAADLPPSKRFYAKNQKEVVTQQINDVKKRLEELK